MPVKILVVDDDESVRQTVRCVLASVGDIIEASNGADALRLIATEKPRLILLDVSMPEMSGLVVVEAAKMLDPSAIIIMLTAERDLAAAAKALKSGARAYVTKPFDVALLRRHVRDLLGLFDRGDAPGSDLPWRVAC